MRPRVIPVVLVSDRYMVKTAGFKKPTYVGDAINTVKLFNEKQADELFVLDIDATRTGKGIDFDFVEDVVSEAFMPVAYGGGVSTMAQAARLFGLGVEKVVVNDACFANPQLIADMSRDYGAQAVVASVDVARRRFSSETLVRHGHGPVGTEVTVWARRLQDLGAGEVLLTAIHREGSRRGLDLDLTARVSRVLDVPLVIHGGADSVADFAPAVAAGASAIAAGTMFTFHGPRKAVLIQYPSDASLNDAFGYVPEVGGGSAADTLPERTPGA